jgi:hypothetical protein
MNTLHRARVVATVAVHRWALAHPDRSDWLVDCLTRHDAGDWGDLDADDVATNTDAVARGAGRILSSYPVPPWLASIHDRDDHVWIVTDELADPVPVVTLLWPTDY